MKAGASEKGEGSGRLGSNAGLAWAGLLLGIAVSPPALAWDPGVAGSTLPSMGSCGTPSGGFLIPGTDGCFRITGLVRADLTAALAPTGFALAATPAGSHLVGPGRGFSHPASSAGARLAADVRVPTDYGPVRLYVSVRSSRGGGRAFSGRGD